MSSLPSGATVAVPRIAIEFCTQCRWMLRAAYYAQELLTTFDGVLGEVALVPTTGGTFRIKLTWRNVDGNSEDAFQEAMIWDRKQENGFPETKILKQRVRDLSQPERNLGHSDKPSSSVEANSAS